MNLKQSNIDIENKYLLLFLLLFTTYFTTLAQNCNDEIKTGEGTYYSGVDGSSSGNCSLPVASGDIFHAALNTMDYDGSNACGACILVTGPKGSVRLKVVDRCPECNEGDVDMTEEAFSIIANIIDGRVPISWRFVPCYDTTNDAKIKVNFKEGSSRYWTAIQFRDINHAIQKMEYEKENNNWVTVDRALYNFFIEPAGIVSPMKLRITSILGEQIELENIALDLTDDHDTGKQFTTPSGCVNSLSVDDFLRKPVFFYPNPTVGIIYLTHSKSKEWVIRDISGKILKEGVSEKIDISAFESGLYLLEMNRNYYRILKK